MEKMLWLDMEMSGLEPERDRVLEVAVLITDLKFNVVDSFETAVFQEPLVLDAMDSWCKDHHGKSGLTARVPGGMPETEVDLALAQMATKHFPSAKVVLCGNSIHQDRRFVEKYLPVFAKTLHYRMLDVSSFKLIFENLYSLRFKKENRHRALDDIQESVAELKYYLEFFDATKQVVAK